MPTAVTEGIRVTVEATYLPERSSPDEGSYALGYTVTIATETGPPAQLRRHRIITDGNGHVEEVEGPGVVGQQPVLDAGESHRYASGAVLSTPVGTMEGTYEMREDGGRVFKIRIPRFGLQVPGILQ